MAETDRARLLADRLLRIPVKKRRASLNGLVRGLEAIFKELPADENDVTAGLFDDPMGDDAAGGDDDDEPSQEQLERLQSKLDAAGIDDPFELGEGDEDPATAGFAALLTAAEDVLDQRPDDGACLAVAAAVIAMSELLAGRNLPTERLEQLEEEHVTDHLGE